MKRKTEIVLHIWFGKHYTARSTQKLAIKKIKIIMIKQTHVSHTPICVHFFLVFFFVVYFSSKTQ